LCPEKYGTSTYKQGTSENYFSVRIALGLAFGRIPVIPTAPFPTHFVTKYISHSKWGTAGGGDGGGGDGGGGVSGELLAAQPK